MISNPYPIELEGESLLLLPEKAIWFPRFKSLIIADVHLGKGAHFRKAGIAIPKALAQEDLSCITDLIEAYHPETIIFLGDLFHSSLNNDLDWFRLWRELHAQIKITLIKGNHDILPQSIYKELHVELKSEEILGSFFLSHDMPSEITEKYILFGHIHPGITISGKGKQKISLPCYYFNTTHGILPAFGKFTGKFSLKNSDFAKIFVIAGKNIYQV